MVELVQEVLVPLTAYLHAHLGTCSGISFVDSTPLRVCANPRIHSHRVFAEQAARGKTSVGWFYGCKLPLVVSDQGEILAFTLTPGNGDDRQPVPQLAEHLAGQLVGDKGYLSQSLAQQLWDEHHVHLLTKVRKNMVQPVRDDWELHLIRHRGIIESVFLFLKQTCQIEHSRHRSTTNFLVHLMAGLVAYIHAPNKPSLHLQWLQLPAAA